MKLLNSILYLLVTFLFIIFSWNCSEEPIENDLSNVNLKIDTLLIEDISANPYWIAPNLGLTDYLYVGRTTYLHSDYTFISFSNNQYNWGAFLDSNITSFDSLIFIINIRDSLTNPPSLWYSADSQFSESKSTYLDFSEDVESGMSFIGEPDTILFKEDITDNDTLKHFFYTEIRWDIMDLFDAITDTIDTNIVRTFILTPGSNDSTILKIFSREGLANYGPKIRTVHRVTQTSNDSVMTDTIKGLLLASSDKTIYEPIDLVKDPSNIGIGSGVGHQFIMSINFDSLSLPDRALIRESILTLPLDTTTIIDKFRVYINPLEEGVDTSSLFFEEDPYSGVGFPYMVNNLTENGILEIEFVKKYLQNISLGNETNLGFKVFASPLNDPFDFIRFNLNNIHNPPSLKILYVTN